jgi:hypothetical protein
MNEKRIRLAELAILLLAATGTLAGSLFFHLRKLLIVCLVLSLMLVGAVLLYTLFKKPRRRSE